MTATLTTNAGNTTIAFSYTSTNQKVQNTAGDAAEFLYRKGYGNQAVPFTSLTNQQKADIIDTWFLEQVINMAKEQHLTTAKDTAGATAIAENTTRYIG